MFCTEGMLRVALRQQPGLKASTSPRFHRFGAILVKILWITPRLPASVSRALRGGRDAAPSKDTSLQERDRDKYRCDWSRSGSSPSASQWAVGSCGPASWKDLARAGNSLPQIPAQPINHNLLLQGRWVIQENAGEGAWKLFHYYHYYCSRDAGSGHAWDSQETAFCP